MLPWEVYQTATPGDRLEALVVQRIISWVLVKRSVGRALTDNQEIQQQ